MSKSRSNVDILNNLISLFGGTAVTALTTLTNLLNTGNTGLINTGGARLVNTPVADDQTLDYYKEAQSFTPTMTFGGASVGITYSTQFGIWTRVGHMVFFSATVILSAKGSSSGTAAIAGLPFAARAGGFGYMCQAIGQTLTAGVQPLKAYVAASAQSAIITKGSTGGDSPTTDADYAATSTIAVTGHYMV